MAKCACGHECKCCSKMRTWLAAICAEFERTVAYSENRETKSMQVPLFGDFASVALLPSIISRMQWWIERFHEALEAGDSTDDE